MSTVRLLAVLAACAVIAGCDPDTYNPGPETCDRSEKGNPSVLFTGGSVEGGVYMSSGWDGELLYFPGGMHYEIEHRLGAVPRFFQAYLSFDRRGTAANHDDEDDGAIGLASGNQVELLRADAQTMVVKNAECVDYWLLVVAGAGTAD